MRVSATGDQIMVDEPVGAALTRDLAGLGKVREVAGNLLNWLCEMEACGRLPGDTELGRMIALAEKTIERSRRG
jgi:hypothetical protein